MGNTGRSFYSAAQQRQALKKLFRPLVLFLNDYRREPWAPVLRLPPNDL